MGLSANRQRRMLPLPDRLLQKGGHIWKHPNRPANDTISSQALTSSRMCIAIATSCSRSRASFESVFCDLQLIVNLVDAIDDCFASPGRRRCLVSSRRHSSACKQCRPMQERRGPLMYQGARRPRDSKPNGQSTSRRLADEEISWKVAPERRLQTSRDASGTDKNGAVAWGGDARYEVQSLRLARGRHLRGASEEFSATVGNPYDGHTRTP